MAFEKHIKTVVGEQQYARLKDKAKKKMIKEFENTVKRSYTGEDKEYSVDLAGVDDNAAFGINDDSITLKS
jgi:ABC-type transporter MlaC component